MNKVTLSVIIANYNDSQYLPDCLRAILAQKFKPLEIILVDDGSTDNSIEVIRGFMRQNSTIRLLQNPRNLGAIVSGNRGLEAASGDFFLWASANDWVLPGLFEKMAHILEKHPHAGMGSAKAYFVSETGSDRLPSTAPQVADMATFFSPSQVRLMLRQAGMWFNSNTTFYQREAVLAVGGFPVEMGWYADTFMEQLVALKCGACYIPEYLGVIRGPDAGISASSRSDLNVYREMMQRAEMLMRNNMKKDFPDGYADEFNRQYNAHIAKEIQRKKRSKSGEVISGGIGKIAKPVAKFALLVVWVEYLIVMSYIILRFRQFSWFRVKKILGKLVAIWTVRGCLSS